MTRRAFLLAAAGTLAAGGAAAGEPSEAYKTQIQRVVARRRAWRAARAAAAAARAAAAAERRGERKERKERLQLLLHERRQGWCILQKLW